jgi:hypothetical protein
MSKATREIGGIDPTHTQPGSIMWVVTPRPGRFNQGKYTVPIVQVAGWAPGPVWAVTISLGPLLPGVRARTVLPVTSRYTDRAILAASSCIAILKGIY